MPVRVPPGLIQFTRRWRLWYSSASTEGRKDGFTDFARGGDCLADRAYVMVNGQIRLSGSGQTLLNDPEVRKAYLGISG